MVEIKVAGRTLKLSAPQELGIEYVNELLSDEFKDDFSLPFSVPVNGNEQVLGHAQEIALNTRPVEWRGAELWWNGLLLHIGTLHLEDATTEQLSLSFSVNGVIPVAKKQRLRKVDFGDAIQAGEMPTYAAAVNAQSYPDAVCCFPMYLNPSFYSRDNPDWYPDTQEWNFGDDYEENDIVHALQILPGQNNVRRVNVYQCIAAHNSVLLSDTDYWKRVSFGIVNRWNHEDEEFPKNTAEGNFYALSPWFYLKYVLQKAAQSIGYTLQGAFMDDAVTSQLVIECEKALDRIALEHYFLATAPGGYTLSGDSYPDFQLTATDDSTPPNQDDDDIWDGTLFTQPALPAAPTVEISVVRFDIKVTFSTPQPLRIFMIDAGTPNGLAPNGNMCPVITIDLTPATTFDLVHHELIEELDGSVAQRLFDGREYYFSLQDPTSTALAPYDATIERLSIQRYSLKLDNWGSGNAKEIIPYATEIRPAEHMPDVSVWDLFNAVREAYGLALDPDPLRKVITLNYADDQVRNAQRDATPLLAGPVAIEPELRGGGEVTLWGVTPELAELEGLELQAIVNAMADLPTAWLPHRYCIIRNSREVVASVPSLGGFHWSVIGHWYGSLVVGEEEGADESRMDSGPVPGTTVQVQGEDFLVPYIDQEAVSTFYPGSRPPNEIRFAWYAGMTPNADGTLYPLATSFNRRHDGTALAGRSMDLEEEHGEHYLEWRSRMRTMGESLITDIYVAAPDLYGQLFRTVLLVHGQPCLLESLPLSLNNDTSPLVARGARLRRAHLRP